jgi:hypothetical protein
MWLVTQMLSSLSLVASAHGGDAGEKPLRVAIVSQPWAAPFTAEELAAALRLRLDDANVGVVAVAPPGGSDGSVTVRWLDAQGLRVERGSGDAVEFPLGDRGRAGADPAQAARRAALFIALFLEQATPLPEVAPPDVVATPSREPSARGTEAPIDSGRPPVVAPPSVVTSGEGAPRGRWSLGAHIGPALAFEDDGVQWTEALTVRGRRYLSARTAVEVGAKLSGEYTATVDSQKIGVADRAFFAGMAYEVWLSPKVAIDLGVAFQYTHAIVDIDGAGPVTTLSAETGSGLAVRTSVGAAWSPAEHVTLGLSMTPSFSFREREYVDEAGGDVLEVGSMILDVTVGGGVRW